MWNDPVGYASLHLRLGSCHRYAVRLIFLRFPWVTLRFTHGWVPIAATRLIWFSVLLRYAASCMREAHLQAVTIVSPYGRLLVLGTTPIILSSAFSSETRGAVDDEMHCQRASRSVRIASMISCGV